MKTFRCMAYACILSMLSFLFACASSVTPAPPVESKIEQDTAQLRSAPAESQTTSSQKISYVEETTLPVRFQKPSYVVKDQTTAATPEEEEKEFSVKVGADISSTTGAVPLREIIKRLAYLKSMNVSWSSDVDQYALVDVDIRAEDDFFKAIDNLLRQQDYFHVVQANTIVVKYKETRKFHIAMPFLKSKFNSGVGGNVLGGTGASGNMQGTIELTSTDNSFDLWENIQGNLDKVLEIWTQATPTSAPPPSAPAGQGQSAQEITTATTIASPPRVGRGYYTIDKPIGLITVTAPRSLLNKIEQYINNLKAELYRQISIEAKIIEVTLNDESKTGIDWSDLLEGSPFNFEMTFGNLSAHNPFGNARSITMSHDGFSLLLNALETQGETKVLANPKISVMNGQPAMISVGENVTFIKSVTSTVDEGVITYSVETSSVMSGLGLAVVATVMENNNVILSLTPVTSQLEEPIEYKFFGGANQVGLPVVNLREMNTTVRVEDGQILVVGGLIDKTNDTTEEKVPLLGDIPLINLLFKNKEKTNNRKELIIILQPKVIS